MSHVEQNCNMTTNGTLECNVVLCACMFCRKLPVLHRNPFAKKLTKQPRLIPQPQR